MPRRASVKRKANPATRAKKRTMRQREDAIDRRDGRRALEEMARAGQRPIPHDQVRREAARS